MQFRKYLFYLIAVALLFGGQFFINRNLITGSPPDIAKYTISGNVVSELINDEPGFIYFWADWCGICSAMKGSVDSIFQDFSGVSVAMQSGDARMVSRHLHKEKLSWNTVVDERGEIGNRYGIKGVPTVFFLGTDGKIKLSTVGYTSEAGLRIRLWLASLM